MCQLLRGPFLVAVALLVTGCSDTPSTCGDVRDPSERTKIVGSEALKFRGRVPRNLLFLSIDTFRRDHLGAHGTLGLTPFLDRIAAEGVVLADHQQCSNWTFGSTTCTLAGRTNVERGHVPRLNVAKDKRVAVAEGTPLLASWLGEADYASALVSGNAWLSDKWGNGQGYDRIVEPKGGGATSVADTGLEELESLLDKGADRWFLHLHYMEPHAPYNPPDEYIVGRDKLEPWTGEDLKNRDQHYELRDAYRILEPDDQDLLEAHLRTLYQGEIRLIDSRLEETWDRLERKCWLSDTLVAIWNDHGEAFWESRYQTHAYELTAPENDGFLMFWAGNIVPGVWNGPTSSIDLAPTILDLFGRPRPPEVTGLPIGDAPADRLRFAEAAARTGGVQAVTRDGFKLQYRWSTGDLTLFDRRSDPLEEHDLYTPDDPVAQDLWRELAPWAERMAEIENIADLPQVWPEPVPE